MSGNESLTDLLMVETSKRQTDLIADLVYQKPELFDELMKIYLRNEEPISRRAVWVIDTVSEKHPEWLESYLEIIAQSLPQFGHDGLKRNSLRILTRSPLPQEYLGELMNICFDWLISPKESVAVKVHAMDILYRISQEEPEMKKELYDSIEWQLAEETPGFKNHGLKLLKKISKEMNY